MLPLVFDLYNELCASVSVFTPDYLCLAGQSIVPNDIEAGVIVRSLSRILAVVDLPRLGFRRCLLLGKLSQP